METKGIDTSKVYEYKEDPDENAGRCDNCGHTLFKSSVAKENVENVG
jgi:hypothetical protein